MISGYTPLVYVAFLRCRCSCCSTAAPVSASIIRVVGEKPEAAEALGISITRIRYIASLLCGSAGRARRRASVARLHHHVHREHVVGSRLHGRGDPDLLQRRSIAGACSAACCSASPTPFRCACRPSAIPPIWCWRCHISSRSRHSSPCPTGRGRKSSARRPRAMRRYLRVDADTPPSPRPPDVTK